MSNEILVRSDRDPLYGLTPDELTAALRRKLEGRVREAYFFGGFAQGRMSAHSDIDLILVCETSTPFPQRGRDFMDLYDVAPVLDLLVYTPEEFARLTHCPTPGFWRSVTASMKRFV